MLVREVTGMKQSRIAITGGIASGKTYITSIIKKLGYPVISCDEIIASTPDRIDIIKNGKLVDGIIEIKGDHFFDKNGKFFDPYDKTEEGYKNAEFKWKCMVENNVKIYTSKELISLGIDLS